MRRPLTLVAVLLPALLVAGDAPVAGTARPSAQPPGPAAGKPTRRALLVGVTKYEHLPDNLHLIGPGNDVELMAKVLTGQFGFEPANIVTLSEANGQKDAKLLPTRANIEREFKQLAAVS